MISAELRQKSVAELRQDLSAVLRKQFKLKLVQATGELKQNHQLRQVRKEIARLKGLLTEKEGKTNAN